MWALQLQGVAATLRDFQSPSMSEGCFMSYVWLWRFRRPIPRDILGSGDGNDFQSEGKKLVRYLNSWAYRQRL